MNAENGLPGAGGNVSTETEYMWLVAYPLVSLKKLIFLNTLNYNFSSNL